MTHDMKKGFTLIELMVSVAIFTVVMMLALSSLLSISAAERKAETLKSVMSNLNFALESMSRTIRNGCNYHCGTSGSGPQNCGSSGDAGGSTGQTYLSLVSVDGNSVAYCLDAGTLKRQITSGAISTNCSDTTSFLPMTAPEVSITDLSFYVKGAPVGDGIQPKVTVTLSGNIFIGSVASSTFSVQTSVTQRIYDQ